MIKIGTINQNEYMIVDKLFTGNIVLISYDERTFEGSRLTLTKQQATNLINELYEMIYEGDYEQ